MQPSILATTTAATVQARDVQLQLRLHWKVCLSVLDAYLTLCMTPHPPPPLPSPFSPGDTLEARDVQLQLRLHWGGAAVPGVGGEDARTFRRQARAPLPAPLPLPLPLA